MYAAHVSEDPSNLPAEQSFALDLAAAEARVDRVDTQAMLDALAVRLEERAPARRPPSSAAVSAAFARSATEVERIDVELGDARFELVRRGGGVLRCARNKVVRGITLKHEEVPIDRLDPRARRRGRRSAAAISEQTRIALEGLVL